MTELKLLAEGHVVADREYVPDGLREGLPVVDVDIEFESVPLMLAVPVDERHSDADVVGVDGSDGDVLPT